MPTIISFQVSIVATGTAQQLTASSISNAVTIAARSTNVGTVVLGNAATVTAGTGFVLEKGQSVRVDLPGGNTASLYAIGTAGDVFSVLGA